MISRSATVAWHSLRLLLMFLYVVSNGCNCSIAWAESDIGYYEDDIEDSAIKRVAFESPKINIGDIDSTICTVDKQMTVEFGKPFSCGFKANIKQFTKEDGTPIKPKFTLTRANINGQYALMMVDPDAPSRKTPTARSWLHWLVVNIKNANVETGKEVIEYNPPTPPKGTGAHRYVFILYKQTSTIPDTAVDSIAGRANFDVNKFAKAFKLGRITCQTYFTTEQK